MPPKKISSTTIDASRSKQGKQMQLKRIVKDSQGGFKLAAVKRNPFERQYVDLTSSKFEDIGNLGLVERGIAAVQRSEIIKAQSIVLHKSATARLPKFFS